MFRPTWPKLRTMNTAQHYQYAYSPFGVLCLLSELGTFSDLTRDKLVYNTTSSSVYVITEIPHYTPDASTAPHSWRAYRLAQIPPKVVMYNAGITPVVNDYDGTPDLLFPPRVWEETSLKAKLITRNYNYLRVSDVMTTPDIKDWERFPLLAELIEANDDMYDDQLQEKDHPKARRTTV